MKKYLLILIYFFSIPLAYAQTNLEELFQAEGEIAADDAKKLLKGYFNPLVKGFGYGMANGWNNTAKVHQPLGFDLTVTVNAATVPNKDLFYDIAALNLQRVDLISVNGVSASAAPTIFGPDVPVTYRYTEPESGLSRNFEGLPGIGLEETIGSSFVPVPMAQLSIGTIKNTDLKIRFVPEVGGDDYSFSLWGVGIMHSIKQYIPGIKSLPFDLSLFVGYTDLSFDLELSDPNNSVTAGQRGTFENNTLTVQGLVSKKFSVLTLYGGLGFNKINSEFNMLGTYFIDTDKNGATDFTLTDPVKAMDFPSSGARATAGVMLKLAVITLHADYTLQEYNTLTVGLGVSVR